MANVQIPNLPAVAALSGAELFEGVQAGTSVKISLAQVIAATRGGTPTTIPIPVSLGGTGVATITGYVKGSGTTPFTGSATIPNTDITGLGTMSTQNASAVAITGGSITGITDLAVADGGTGASTLTGYVKGSGTSPLTASATIPSTDITGLGTMSTQNANAVAITGGSITGITDLAVADGGTGASTLTGYVKGNGTTPLTASATIPSTDITGLGTMSTQNANSVAVTGGAINGTTIGATSPSTIAGTTGTFTGDLTVTNANPSLSFFETGVTADRDARIRLNDNDLIFETVTDAGVQVRENMRITYLGDVGIGTSSPRASLDLTSSILADDYQLLLSSLRPNIVFEDTSSGSATDFQLYGDGNALAFLYGDASTNIKLANEAMRITNAGRLGIGTVSPSTLFDVAGTANATNMTRGGSQVYSRDNILATVSQSAGVPTGGIIERGSSANGEYVRYADGTMICVIYAAGTQTTSTASGSIFRATNASTWTFPSTFAVAPAVSGMAEENNTRWVSFDLPTTTSVAFRHLNSLTSAVAVNTRLMAIGRWF
jgi:hypothetical protein